MLFDDGYQFGIGAFETIAVQNKIPILLEKHLKRLNNSLSFLKIDKIIDKKIVLDYVKNIKKQNYALKIIVSEKNTIIKTRANPYINSKLYESGFNLKYSSILKNETSPFSYHKTLNYAENILEKRKAKIENVDDFIFINTKGFISEGSVCNIFFINNEKIYTPSISSGILPGIVRAYLCESYNIEEKEISPSNVEEMEECFVTNSLMGIMPVKRLGDIEFIKHTITKILMQNYTSFIENNSKTTKT